jgi:hypothetical protein
VSGQRRVVRATPDFFRDLDMQLGDDRGGTGQPSRGDFQTYELLRIVEKFATEFDHLPESIPGRSDYRILIAAGVVVPVLSVVGQLASDGAVELVQLDIDTEPIPGSDPDLDPPE